MTLNNYKFTRMNNSKDMLVTQSRMVTDLLSDLCSNEKSYFAISKDLTKEFLIISKLSLIQFFDNEESTIGKLGCGLGAQVTTGIYGLRTNGALLKFNEKANAWYSRPIFQTEFSTMTLTTENSENRNDASSLHLKIQRVIDAA